MQKMLIRSKTILYKWQSTILSVGIDPKKVNIFIQSQVPSLFEMTSYFMNLVSLARLKRNPTIKEEIKLRGFENTLPVGFLTYPISQASDILAFNANIIPVGDDQLPMIEQAREIATSFNNTYGQVLVLPQRHNFHKTQHVQDCQA